VDHSEERSHWKGIRKEKGREKISKRRHFYTDKRIQGQNRQGVPEARVKEPFAASLLERDSQRRWGGAKGETYKERAGIWVPGERRRQRALGGVEAREKRWKRAHEGHSLSRRRLGKGGPGKKKGGPTGDRVCKKIGRVVSNPPHVKSITWEKRARK